MSTITNYLSTTAGLFGDAWNRFWYLPSHPLPTAVLRICTGLITFWMLLTLGFDLLRYFGPSGIVRVSMLEAIYPTNVSLRLSYLDYVQDSGTLQAVHYAGLAVVLAFTLGLWTRITSILSLVVFLSYFHRGRMLTGVDEPVVAMLLFYLCFAPTGACLSLDAWRKHRRESAANSACSSLCDAAPTYTATIGLRLIQVHVSLIYFMMFCATLQYNAVWWNGTAVWWLIARPESALIDLRWLYQYPYVINFWTSSLIFFYLAFALLIWNRSARPLLVAISAIVWSGTAILTGLIPFCAAMFVAGLAFISADQWKSLGCNKPEPAMPKAAA